MILPFVIVTASWLKLARLTIVLIIFSISIIIAIHVNLVFSPRDKMSSASSQDNGFTIRDPAFISSSVGFQWKSAATWGGNRH